LYDTGQRRESPKLPPFAFEKKMKLSDIHKVDPYYNFPARHEDVDTQGWNYSHDIFERTIAALKPNLIVEVGTWKGASAITMARAVQKLGLPTKIVCVDTWLGSIEMWLDQNDGEKYGGMNIQHGGPMVYRTFINNIVCLGLTDIIIPFQVPSALAAQFFQKKKIHPDMVYVDASHEFEDVWQDIKAWFALLADGGVMIGDDYEPKWPGVIQAVEKLSDYWVVPIDIEREKWSARKGKQR
jgi:hypothetical protein